MFLQIVLGVNPSTIDKKLEIYTKLEIELQIYKKNLEYELEIDKNLENFKLNFEGFLSMVDELTITLISNK